MLSAVGAAGILGGAFNGASFMNYDEDFSSPLMAGAFAVAVAAYVWGLAGRTRNRGRVG